MAVGTIPGDALCTCAVDTGHLGCSLAIAKTRSISKTRRSWSNPQPHQERFAVRSTSKTIGVGAWNYPWRGFCPCAVGTIGYLGCSYEARREEDKALLGVTGPRGQERPNSNLHRKQSRPIRTWRLRPSLLCGQQFRPHRYEWCRVRCDADDWAPRRHDPFSHR